MDFRTGSLATGCVLLGLTLLLACVPSDHSTGSATLAAAGGDPSTALPTAVRACPGDGARDIGDIDGDGIPDPVVETYGANGGGPAYLDIHNSTAAQQVIGGADVGMQGVASLGGVTLVVDVNRDGCADVLTFGNDAMYAIPGSVEGLVPAAVKRLGPPEGEGNWGSSMAVLKDLRLLVVGAPEATASPHRGGAVYLYPLADDGTPGKPTVLHQDSPGVPGNSEKGDWFGEYLAADGNLLAIGAAGETNSGRRGSGAVTLLKFTGVGRAFNAVRWTQDSPGFETRAETWDAFGSRLAVRGNYVAMGVPNEAIGRADGAGIVHVVELAGGAGLKVKKVHNFHQGSAGIPDENETNDHWGAALALGANIGCTPMTVVIGAHGEKLGKSPSGSVTLVGLGKRCASRWLPDVTFGVPFRYFGRQIVTLSSSAGASAPDVVLVGDAFSRAIGDVVLETGNVIAVRTVGEGKWMADPVLPRDGYHAYSNYGQGLGVTGHG
ncbi:MAG TPA: hypothetical protein PKV13_11300 [Propionicimonas sp.]|nr:hypothetical protein [Propionicimonas sp.]HRA07185.1 hypothetical protein [Propionicimonas sp.]